MAGQTTRGILHLFLEGHKLNPESGNQMLPFLMQWDRMGRVLTGRSHQATWWAWKGHHVKLLMSAYAPVPRMSFLGVQKKKEVDILPAGAQKECPTYLSCTKMSLLTPRSCHQTNSCFRSHILGWSMGLFFPPVLRQLRDCPSQEKGQADPRRPRSSLQREAPSVKTADSQDPWPQPILQA